MRWTDSDLAAARERLSKAVHPSRPLESKPRASKFGNHPTYVDGLRFASKREADYYQQLKMLKAAGEIRGFACQVSVPLPSGKRRMVIDFMVIQNDGAIRWRDAKGFVTPEWNTKRVELEHSLGIQIETV